MSDEKITKINNLLRQWPNGVPGTSRWMKSFGISSSLLDRYIKSSWLKRLGNGAYSKLDDEVTWEGAVCALQTQLHLNAYIGGKTALEFFGKIDSIPLGKGAKAFIFSDTSVQKLPGWFLNCNWNRKIIHKRTNLFPEDFSEGIETQDFESFSVKLSGPERAAIEYTYMIKGSDFECEEAKNIFEMLHGLRIKKVQSLLEACNSIKTKRIFMFLAEIADLQWINKVDKSKIDFGSGNREFYKGGKLHPKYLITVPESLLTNVKRV
jgi:hypothetical protein